MNRFRCLLAALLLAWAVPAAALQDDKIAHASVSFMLGFAAGNQWPQNKPLAFGVAMMPGLIKEISDRGGSGFSRADLLADAVGAALGVYSAHWLIARSRGTTVIAYRQEF